jgi:hypothetical protein
MILGLLEDLRLCGFVHGRSGISLFRCRFILNPEGCQPTLI